MDNNELKELYTIKAKYDVMIAAIESAARLNYDKSAIGFSDAILDAVFMAVEPDKRAAKWNALKGGDEK